MGFTGTPIDETIAVFGPVVDRYTMKESSDDGITVRIAYEPRLARVLLSEDEARKIQEYYDRCAEEGSTEDAIEESQRAMSSMGVLLRDPDRLNKLAADMVEHYERLCGERPGVVQKAMIVCSNRAHAFDLLNAILAIRPEWGVAKKAENESNLSPEQLEELEALPKISIVATRGKDDPRDLFDACGTRNGTRSWTGSSRTTTRTSKSPSYATCGSPASTFPRLPLCISTSRCSDIRWCRPSVA